MVGSLTEVDWTQAAWRKSSHSGPDQGCVEVALADGAVGVRDTKHREGPMLIFSPESWRAFIDALKEGGLQERA